MQGEIDMYYRQAVAAFMEAQIRDQYRWHRPSCPPASSALPVGIRPVPDVIKYDQLLTRNLEQQ